MGTRALVTVIEDGAPLLTLYRQYDGYPSELGKDLAAFLTGRRIGNGITDPNDSLFSNGMGCLAASLIAALKDGPGNVYIVPAGTTGRWEEFTYTIADGDDGRPRLTASEVYSPDSTGLIYSGLAEDWAIPA